MFYFVSGNTNKSNKSKTVFSSSVIGPHGNLYLLFIMYYVQILGVSMHV